MKGPTPTTSNADCYHFRNSGSPTAPVPYKQVDVPRLDLARRSLARKKGSFFLAYPQTHSPKLVFTSAPLHVSPFPISFFRRLGSPWASQHALPPSALPTSSGTSPPQQPSPECIYPLQLHFIIPSAVLPAPALTISLPARACKPYPTPRLHVLLLTFSHAVHAEDDGCMLPYCMWRKQSVEAIH